MCLAWYLLVLTRVFSLQWEAIKDSDLTKRRIESIRHVLGHEKSGFSQKFSFKYLLSERVARSVFLFWKKKNVPEGYISGSHFRFVLSCCEDSLCSSKEYGRKSVDKFFDFCKVLFRHLWIATFASFVETKLRREQYKLWHYQD